MRQLKLLFSLMVLATAGTLFAQPTTNLAGSTGLYMMPTAKVQKARQIGLGYHYISEANGNVINATAGIIPKLEFGYGQLLQDDGFNGDNDANGTFSLKYQFVSGKIDWAGYASLQAFGSDIASQWLVLATTGDLNSIQASFGFGYTFAPNPVQPGSNLDVYMGLEKKVVSIISVVAEFGNRGHAWNQNSFSEGRGIFHTGLRLGAKSGKLGFNADLLGTDLFDEGGRGIALGGYISYQL